MGQTITDKQHKYLILALSSAFVLMLLVFSNIRLADLISTANNSNDIVFCEYQNDGITTSMFMEEEELDNSDKVFCDCCQGRFHFTDIFLPHQFSSADEEHNISLIKNYFHNDLSPPLFMKG